MKYFSFLFFFFPLILMAETIKINGEIENSNTREALACVNVAISGSYYGTVSNFNGEFNLVVPEKLVDSSISFSAIGYENFSIPINTISGFLKVSLKAIDYELNEIVVMPDSTLRLFLKKAFDKIPENYPDYPTRSLGFYRESIKEKDGDYLTFTEAILDVYKTSYKNKSDGQVKMVKSRKNKLPGSDSINDIHFYGGIFTPHRSDIVKNRSEIIKPSKKYSYEFEGIEMYNGKEVYCIAFLPVNENKSGSIGRFYIDKETLAYVKFDYHLNDEALKWREKKDPLTPLRDKEKRYIKYYDNIRGRFYFKSAFLVGKIFNQKTKCMLELNDEYIMTELIVDSVNKIPFSEQVSYTTVIADVAEDYQVSDWKDYTILQNETIENKFFSVSTSDSLLSRVYKPSKPSFFEQIFNILSRFESDIGMIAYPVSNLEGNYSLAVFRNMESPLNFQKTVEGKSFFSQYECSVKFKMKKQFKLVYTTSENISGTEKSLSNYCGLEYSVPLKTYGKKIFFSVQGGYNFMSMMTSLGEITNNDEFDFGGKKFDSSLIEAFYGVKANGIRTRADLSFQLNSFLHLKLIVGRDFNLNQKSAIKLVENKGFFLSRKTAEVGMDNEAIEFFYEGQQLHESNFKLSDYHFGIGISMHF